MLTSPSIMFELAREHQNELIQQARRDSLARQFRGGRQHRRHRSVSADDGAEISHRGTSAGVGSLVACEVPVAEPVR